jgi:hypothetical protein
MNSKRSKLLEKPTLTTNIDRFIYSLRERSGEAKKTVELIDVAIEKLQTQIEILKNVKKKY